MATTKLKWPLHVKIAVMFAMAVSAAIALSTGQTAPFDAKTHTAWLERKWEDVRAIRKDLDRKVLTKARAVERCGAILGESRKRQSALTSNLKAQTGPDPHWIRLVRMQGILDAYVASAILGMDGDEESQRLAKTLDAAMQKLLEQMKA